MAAPRAGWQSATLRDKRTETDRAATLHLSTDEWPGHRAGQHVDVRLTAEDGYQAQRSYSIASPPEDDGDVALTVERLDDGEVSPYLVDEMAPGDMCELRGPIGGWFVWDADDGGPLLLVGGGSGVVPLMSMLRHRAALHSGVRARLLLSARSLDDALYADELHALDAGDDELDVSITLTRTAPPDWAGYARRVDRSMLEEVAWPAADRPRVYVCGPTPFVESVAAGLVDLGHDAGLVKTERFGATGS
ncbi:MAG TPA: ferredoxin reductase [Solirubrobacteraceae bacterium]|nr:ferredoxin reductase [Solirubrobacteraceae bacterium]